MLMIGVRAVADRTQAIERRRVKAGRVAVGRAAGRALLELELEVAREVGRHVP